LRFFILSRVISLNSLKSNHGKGKMKLKLILLVFLTAIILARADDLSKMRYDPIRQIGNKVYSLQPVYDWVALPSTDRNPRPMQEWIGISDYKFSALIYKVEEITPDGLIIGSPGEVFGRIYTGQVYSQPPILLRNYPDADSLVDNQIIQFLALRVGNYQYTGTDGSTVTIAAYDYGKPYVPPPMTPEQIIAAQEAAKARAISDKIKAEHSQVKVVMWLQSQATNGSASAQCSLGLHYLNGQGCDTNHAQGIYWLTHSANQGDVEASNKLAEIQKSQ
jgi:hypothetical protein